MLNKSIVRLIIGLVITAVNINMAFSDSIHNALKLCAVFDSTGMLSENCEVSGTGLNPSVDVSIDTSSKEAIDICRQVSNMMIKDKVHFDQGEWKIRIFSPFSNGKTIATCKLPG